MSVWNPDNCRDVAESVGIASLNKDVADSLARDVEYRIGQVLEEALKFMRRGRRTTLSTQDISQALRALEVEPLYGYESTKPLRFGEASLGPGQPLYYIEDEEVDFEKLINAPLPKVPREISMTAHWLAVEGVQPSIPQNPTSTSTDPSSYLPRGPSANQHLAATSGADNVNVKPLVKHVISKELNLYFDRICNAVLDASNEEYRLASLASLRTDPAVHQLVPYFVQFAAEKVTHNNDNLFTLTQSLHLLDALLSNPSLYLDPYVSSIVPTCMTCLIGRHLGSQSDPPQSVFTLRDLACSLILLLIQKYARSTPTLKPRLARTCLKNFLDPHKSLGTIYGAVTGLSSIMGAEGIRLLVLPHCQLVDEHLIRPALNDGDERKKFDAEQVIIAFLRAIESLEDGAVGTLGNGTNGYPEGETLAGRLKALLGDVIGEKVMELGKQRPKLVEAVLEAGNKIPLEQ
ncbi:MAG: hypothetical protein M1820_010599 [Bogoriella megaspora]|nr:MAG: hypothetical protein M1820_010599 [Bogoriella megaspora]